MKMIVAFAALVAVVSAAAIDDSQTYVVKEEQHDNIGVGGYKYSYELSDGQSRIETAQAAQIRDPETNEDRNILRVTGQFSYVDPLNNNKLITVYYTADEHGFRAEGDHLPKAPVV